MNSRGDGYNKLVAIQLQEILNMSRMSYMDEIAYTCCAILNERKTRSDFKRTWAFVPLDKARIEQFETPAIEKAYKILARHFKRLRN